MSKLHSHIIEQLKSALVAKYPQEALPNVLGGISVAENLWHFFSSEFATMWNSPKMWREVWPGLPPELFFFGEDLWGNQLTLKPRSENVWLWNHENAELLDLLVDPITLLETVSESGLDWIDFYTAQMLAVGRSRLLDVPDGSHLHWTQPLILGGSVTTTNTAVVEKVMHLRGHGALWAQLQGLPSGTEILFKPKPQ